MRTAFARARAVRLLPSTCQVLRATPSSDGAGGQTQTWPVLGTVACAYGPRDISASEHELAGRLGMSTLWNVTVPSDADVTERDRLRVDGRTFEVVSILGGSFGPTRRVTAAEVR